jgi:hypothetical protein
MLTQRAKSYYPNQIYKKDDEVGNMLFVVTAKWKPENMAEFIKIATSEMTKPPREGTKDLGTYILLGRCQMVSIVDAPDEKTIFKIHQPYMQVAECDWVPAIKAEDAAQALAE